MGCDFKNCSLFPKETLAGFFVVVVAVVLFYVTRFQWKHLPIDSCLGTRHSQKDFHRISNSPYSLIYLFAKIMYPCLKLHSWIDLLTLKIESFVSIAWTGCQACPEKGDRKTSRVYWLDSSPCQN